jgi:co-chaperonin GroES (HSP10)
MRVLGKYVVIDKVTDGETTDSGLVLSNEEADINLRYRKGVVVQPGADVYNIKRGDVVFYDRNAGHSLLIDGVSHSVILERDVVVVL